MKEFEILSKNKNVIIALGAESAGNFSVFKNGRIYFSQDFGDLLDDANYQSFEKELFFFIKKEKIKPDVILHDLHPLLKTTALAQKLTKKFKTETFPVQHHMAHIFSQLGSAVINNPKKLKSYSLKSYYGIALDGTGYGTDGRIWGGECFAISNFQFPISNQFSNSNNKISKQKMRVERISHLENQTMIGGELAIREPARILIAILAKVKNQKSKIKNSIQKSKSENDKKFVYKYLQKFYSSNEFELLWNQLQKNFNCQETSSAGRILDAVSVLLGFAKNERNFKHQATYLLEKNSTKPYSDLKPKIDMAIHNSQFTIHNEFSMIQFPENEYVLNTTHLFKYLIKNLDKDKKRLAATAQLYIAQGLGEIIKQSSAINHQSSEKIYLSGGISNNKIISDYFEKLENKKPGISIEMPGIPRGDAGLSFGQIIHYLSN